MFDDHGIRIADPGETPLSPAEILHAIKIGEATDEKDEIDTWQRKVTVRTEWEPMMVPVSLMPRGFRTLASCWWQRPASLSDTGPQADRMST